MIVLDSTYVSAFLLGLHGKGDPLPKFQITNGTAERPPVLGLSEQHMERNRFLGSPRGKTADTRPITSPPRQGRSPTVGIERDQPLKIDRCILGNIR